MESGIHGDVGIGLDKDLLFGKCQRNYLIPDGGTILQEERELRAEGFVVDIAQVSEPRSFEVEAFDVVHC